MQSQSTVYTKNLTCLFKLLTITPIEHTTIITIHYINTLIEQSAYQVHSTKPLLNMVHPIFSKPIKSPMYISMHSVCTYCI